jgi:hypothetical protein
MNLDILIPQQRFIVSPGRVDAPLKMPALLFGDTIPVTLRGWDYAANGELKAVDLSTYDITLLVGPPNVRPELGFWQVTTTAGTSKAIPSRASNEEVKTALADCFGPVNVRGGYGSYIVTLEQAGIWVLPTATFRGNTLTGVLVFQITPGTATTPAQYRIEVLEVAPARVVPANWSAGNTTTVNSVTQVSGRLWQLTLDPLVDAGFFTLTVDGQTTQFLAFNAAAYQIEVALSAAGKPATVMPNGIGGFFISFQTDVTAASVGGHLRILPFMQSALGLTSSGLRELLDGLQFTPVKLSMLLTKDGKTETVAMADVILQMPINQPAVISIDAPEMAGITFAFSDDMSYMEVYQDGIYRSRIMLTL